MIIRAICLLFFLNFILFINAQNIPSQWKISEDGRYLIAGDNIITGLYDEASLEEIRLTFPQSNYWTLLTQNYASKTDISATLKYKDQTLDSVGIRFKGQTSYFANNSQKKSFNISINGFIANQTMGEYKTLNLNNAFQDPSFMREILYYHLIRPHTPAAKANFVKLYINDQYWGVYLNVQQLNKDFLKEWYESNDGNNFRADSPTSTGGGGGGGGGAQWGDGTAAINFLGNDTTTYQKYYTLKSSGYNNPWTELNRACDVLNNSGNALETALPEYFDIDKILWHLACEIAYTDDDSYVYKGKMDYYLYQDDITGRWATYDYDANSVMSTDQNRISWSPFYNETKANYPLLNKVLKIPAYRQRYLAHLRTILTTSFDENYVNSLIDTYDNLIKESVFADTKKTTSNQAYTNGITGLKNFIRNRKNFLLANVEVNKNSPLIYDTKYTSKNADYGKVTSDDAVTITSRPVFEGGFSEVNAHVSPAFTGVFSKMSMNDMGINGDLEANDGIYSVTLPTYNEGSLVRFYVEVIGNDATNTRAYYPTGTEHHVMFFEVAFPYSGPDKIAINEFMASNSGIVMDEHGDNDDWIELFNLTNQDIDLTNYSISDKVDNPTKFVFSEGTIIPANGYLIVWADEQKSQGPLHANFKLSASGEEILLFDNNQTLLDQVVFGAQIQDKSAARIPNGTGDFVIGDHTFNKKNDGTTSTNNTENAFLLSIYPNPAIDVVQLENNASEDLPCQIYSRMGQLERNMILPAHSTTIVSSLPAGVYFIRSAYQSWKLIIL
ncbi:MAG: CotH kinase family protein [Saprospiraceae bacterium]